MGKGFYISKTVGIVGIVLAAGVLATITALPVVYSQEKSKNNEVKSTDPTMAPSNEPWDQWRLPQTLRLYIFTGLSSVVFRCVEKTNLILIHSNKLNMTKHPTLIGLGGKPAPTIESIVMHTKTQYMAIHLKEELTAGESYELYTEFLGELSDDLGGFYRSEYYENGIKKVVATTQMQATDARKAFPCFDEPAMKAVFHITLNHDPATVALSNGVNITVDDTLVTRTTFAPTEVMSTYLLAFIVSDFIFIEQNIENRQIRIFARQEAINAGQGEYALSVTGPILKFFEKYYNVPYPLPKSYQIALPDFNTGAMENWGLITYRETALLYDEEISSNENKERIVTVISHELAHQWFGNLVTPDWNIKDLIVLNDVHKVFAIDALASSHPLSSKEEEIERPEQITEMFDTISYSKGASVLRMLSTFLTEKVFTQGLQTYLDHFKFNNTVYTDLWEHLQKTKMKIADKINTTADLPESVLNTFSQARAPSMRRLYAPTWSVFSAWCTACGADKIFCNISLILSFLQELLPRHGYIPKVLSTPFRVQVITLLVLPPSEQDQKLNLLYPVRVLKVYIEHSAPFRQLEQLFVWFDGPAHSGELWQASRHNQVNALRVACSTGLEACTTLVKTWFQQWMENLNVNPIKANLRSAVYCSAIAAGGEKEWNFAWEMFEKATVASEKDKLRAAMACATEPWLLNRYLKYTLDPEKIRKQDATSTIISIASNVVGQPLAWDFVRANWEYIFNQYGGGSFSFSNLINGVTNRFSTEFELQQVLSSTRHSGSRLLQHHALASTPAERSWPLCIHWKFQCGLQMSEGDRPHSLQ
uniref:Aminopeptidase n=1 Tax=Sinocyclocheilus grahami TaxID=75366 RepID=A0A672Q6S8_SINGR